jgi:hypothetical protein
MSDLQKDFLAKVVYIDKRPAKDRFDVQGNLIQPPVQAHIPNVGMDTKIPKIEGVGK